MQRPFLGGQRSRYFRFLATGVLPKDDLTRVSQWGITTKPTSSLSQVRRNARRRPPAALTATPRFSNHTAGCSRPLSQDACTYTISLIGKRSEFSKTLLLAPNLHPRGIVATSRAQLGRPPFDLQRPQISNPLSPPQRNAFFHMSPGKTVPRHTPILATLASIAI
ncbi:hypothetical protein LZ31DRAFT_189845 [Colletotrichum somersetense]|nr:hypothetical protein LZ31DRAFT_189845 [Colletotrichum somersetense]